MQIAGGIGDASGEMFLGHSSTSAPSRIYECWWGKSSLETLVWARDNGCPWDAERMVHAVAVDFTECSEEPTPLRSLASADGGCRRDLAARQLRDKNLFVFFSKFWMFLHF